MTVTQLSAMLEAKEITSVEIVAACLQAIELRNDEIHAFLEVFAEDALASAAASDERRKEGKPLSSLDGVPIAIKDNIVIRGKICSCASKMLESFTSPYDATVITKIKAAGMPILGRVNMDEFAMGSTTERSAFGATKNPWNTAHVPGGSSGGSAAAVAAGMTPAALGTDTGGSIRQPASFCGVVGVKPAYGAVSRYGAVAFASSLDQIGPIAKTVEDSALIMQIIAGHDIHDATSDQALAQDYTANIDQGSMKGITIGMPKECFGEGLSPEVDAAIKAAANHMQTMGAVIKEVSIPDFPYALSAYYVISSAEASSNLARFDGIRYGYRAQAYEDLDELYRKSRQEAFGMEVKRRILLGTFALSSGYQDQFYLKAQQVRELLRYEIGEVLEECDFILTPVTPTTAYKLGEKSSDPMEMYLGDIYSVPANIAGLPAISMPCGMSADGLPIGMSLMGAKDALPRMLAIGAAYERAQNVNENLHPYDSVEGSDAK
ncbi:MAG: Asp-tRNA(Asn)/Glu-tRNA(Gln) amidotransferase subunit GatA [Clostridiales bacterium]|nr:Asp-tRNA(Asn)/Glu-tRNA(Gln) amidotransferase subunit GatA [Clostridiales bacterium]